jgi:hypothetical protein
MNLLKPVAAIAILSAIAAPSFARTENPAAKLSLAVQDSDSGGTDMSEGGGDGTTIALVGLGVGAAVGAALLLGDGDSDPASN